MIRKLRDTRKTIAILLAICIAICMFAGCSGEETTEATEKPVKNTEAPSATLSPDITIDFDPAEFDIQGTTLVEYIGKGGEVKIPDDVTVIGANAFSGCENVTAITFPKSVNTVEAFAFEGCTGLKGKFVPPNNLNYIDDYAFSGCTGITEIEFQNKLYTFGTNIFEGCTSLEKVTFPQKLISGLETTIPEYTFDGCTSLKEVVGFDDAVSIGKYAFRNCTSLEKITIPAKARTIFNNAFEGCTKLSDITFSKVLNTVGADALNDTPWYAAKAQEAAQQTEDAKRFVIIGQSSILLYVPAETTGDVEIKIPKDTFSILEGAFDEFVDRITSVDFEEASNRMEIINQNVFKGAVNLKSIKLPKRMTVISNGLFDGCVNLEEVTVESKLTSIGNDAFNECAKLGSIYLPDSITFIGDNAFYGCKSLTKIVLPHSIETIGDFAFKDCENISEFIFTLKLSNVGVQAFDNTKWYNDLSNYETQPTENQFHVVGNGVLVKADIFEDTVVIPETVKSIGAFTFNGWTEIKDREFYGSKLPKSITIPDTVTRIGDYAFYFCRNLDTVFISDSVKEIGEKAFYGCDKITSVALPAGLTEIKDYTFYGCISLSEVIIPDSVQKIGKYAFYNCSSLEEIALPGGISEIGAFAFTGTYWFDYNSEDYMTVGSNLIKCSLSDKEITIPDSITCIVGGAFENEYIEKINVPANITEVKEYAFSGCVSLKNISFAGTVTSIGQRAFNGCQVLEYKAPEGCNVADDAFAGCPQ